MRLLIILLTTAALAQTPTGTVQVASTITASAGSLICTGTATVGSSLSTMHLKCVDGSLVVLPDIDIPVSAPGSTAFSIQRGSNTVTWLLTKGNPTPDRWEVAANGVTKSGTF